MTEQIVIVGLGRFGVALARALVEGGYEVLALDSDLAVVQRYANQLPTVVQADSTDQDTLLRLGVADYDVGVVAIGENLEDSILTTLVLKRIGLKRVIAKSQSESHGDILNRVGADRVLYPERDTALRLAHQWASQAISDSLEVVDGYTIGRASVPHELVGKTLGQVNLVQKYDVTLIALARGRRVMLSPSREETFQPDDILVVGGDQSHLQKLFA